MTADNTREAFIPLYDLFRDWMINNMPYYIMYDKHNTHPKQDYVMGIDSIEEAEGADVYEYYDCVYYNYVMYRKVGCNNEWIIANTTLSLREYVDEPCTNKGKVYGWAKVDDDGLITSGLYRDLLRAEFDVLRYRLYNRINRRDLFDEHKEN